MACMTASRTSAVALVGESSLRRSHAASIVCASRSMRFRRKTAILPRVGGISGLRRRGASLHGLEAVSERPRDGQLFAPVAQGDDRLVAPVALDLGDCAQIDDRRAM